MSRNLLLAAEFVLVLMVTPAAAQRGGPSRADGPTRGGGNIPTVGEMLPELSAFDEQGEHFSTASMRGSYTVLVFGCLT